MSIRVYGWEDNPAVDPRRFKLSDVRGAEVVASRRGKYIVLACGRKAIQLFPQPVRESQNIYERIHEGQWIGAEIPGIKVIPAAMEKNPTMAHLEVAPLRKAACRWDWSVA